MPGLGWEGLGEASGSRRPPCHLGHLFFHLYDLLWCCLFNLRITYISNLKIQFPKPMRAAERESGVGFFDIWPKAKLSVLQENF